MNNFFSELSDQSKLFTISLSICIPAILIAIFIKGYLAGGIIACFIFTFLIISRPVWMPKDHGRNRVARYSIFIIASAVSLPLWEKYVQAFVEEVLKNYLNDSYRDLNYIPDVSPYFTLVLLAIVVILINFLLRDKTGMIKHPIAINEDFPEINYKQSLRRYCRVLKKTIEDLDLESNWSSEDFTSLDAEVEIRKKNGRKKKIKELLSALRGDRETKVFLVLGDPGSGKSVALRKLCKDLLKEVEKTERLPIYVNLKEWYIEEKWSKNNPPTNKQLYDFILNQLKGKDIFADEFLKKYFDKMLESGRLFIILDSFDEIPMVLDEKENSWLIDKLSEIIYYTLAGANDSRGILSSRFFRRPTNKFDAKTKLIIRPFTDRKITLTLKKSINFNDSLLKQLFNERKELIPVARNPFSNSLIANYAKENDNKLPNSQAELYKDYLQRRLQNCEEFIGEKGSTIQKVLAFAEEIAFLMFESEKYGLEIPIPDLKQLCSDFDSDSLIDILVYARVGRIGRGKARKFSFVHRRFNEYFVSQRLLSSPSLVPTEAIPEDSRWRDALVLYCGIAPQEIAIGIANFCWENIKEIENNDLDLVKGNLHLYLRSMHCLRFLNEAFRARKDCLNDFQDTLEILILNKIIYRKEDNLLKLKLIVESTGVIGVEKIDEIILPALEIRNKWVRETAIDACKYFPAMSHSLSTSIASHFNDKNDLFLFLNYMEIINPFKFSDAFREVHKRLNRTYFSILISFLGSIFMFFFSPLISIIYISTYIYDFYYSNILGREVDINLLRSLINIAYIPFLPILILVLINPNIDPSAHSFIMDSPDYFVLNKNPWLILTCILFFLPRFIDELLYIRRKRFLEGLRSLLKIGTVFIIGIVVMPIMVITRVTIQPFFKKVMFTHSLFKPYEKITQRIASIGYKDIFSFVVSILLVIIFLTVTGAVVYLFEAVDVGIEYLAILIGLGFLIGLISYIGRDFLKLKKIKKLRREVNWDRMDIQKFFWSLNNQGYRLRFVKFLDDENIKAHGYWEEGKIPNYRNDKSSTLLAKLEEKWLGLDR